MLKRIIALCIVLLMIAPLVMSCADDSTDADEQSVVTTDGSVADENDEYNITDAIGTRDYGGRDVLIGTGANDTGLVYIEGNNGSILNDSLYKRNKTLESRLNVKLKAKACPDGGNWGLVNHITTTVMSGDVGFDILYSFVWTTATLVPSGYLNDLSLISEIDLEQPYWAGYANEAMKIGDAYPMITGAASLEFYRSAWVIGVNKTRLDQQTGAPDLFKVVNDGQWTLEYLRELSSKYYSDLGTEGTDAQDLLGFATADSVHIDPFFTSSNVKFLTRDTQGFLQFGLDVEHMYNATGEVSKLFSAESTYAYTDDVHVSVTDKFSRGEALAMNAELGSFEYASMRNMTDEYLILPMPKLSEKQEDYYTHLHDAFYVYAVPISTPYEDQEVVGAVLEVLASEAYRQVMPVYYEMILKVRIAESPENAEMIDRIMTNVAIDPSCPYTRAVTFNVKDGWGNNMTSLWRDIIQEAFRTNTNPVVASLFGDGKLKAQVDEKLNGAGGLNTAFRP